VNAAPGEPAPGRRIVGDKDARAPIPRRTGQTDPRLITTGLFRDGARRPQTMLAGVASRLRG
jgi:hypothetical protein